jgi:hypothetical protein
MDSALHTIKTGIALSSVLINDWSTGGYSRYMLEHLWMHDFMSAFLFFFSFEFCQLFLLLFCFLSLSSFFFLLYLEATLRYESEAMLK